MQGDRTYIGGVVGDVTTPPEEGSVMTSEGWRPLSAANLIGEVNGTKYNVVVDDTDTTNPQFGIEEIA